MWISYIIGEYEMQTVQEKRYNGYTNFETWLMALNIDNDSTIFYDVLYIIKMNIKEDDSVLVGAIKQYLEDRFYIDEYSIYHICNSWTNRDFNEIDFYDLIENWKEAIKEGA